MFYFSSAVRSYSASRRGFFSAAVVSGLFCGFPQPTAGDALTRTVVLSDQFPSHGRVTQTTFTASFPNRPAINSLGQIALQATIDDRVGIWSDRTGTLEPVVVAEQVHSTPRGRFVFTDGTFYGPTISDAGKIAFSGRARSLDDEDLPEGVGIWTSDPAGGLQPLALIGDQAVGFPKGTVFSDINSEGYYYPPVMGGTGSVVFIARTTSPTMDNGNGLWIDDGGGLQLIVQSGAPAPVPNGNYVFVGAGALPALNRADGVGFYSRYTEPGMPLGRSDPAGIWTYQEGGLRLVATAKSPTPSDPIGAEFRGFGLQFYNSAGHSAFMARLNSTFDGVTSENDDGIWSESGGSLHPVAREGDPAPGVPGGAVFGLTEGEHRSPFRNFVFNSASQAAFTATLQPGTGDVTDLNESGIWSERGGELGLVVRQGDQAPGAPPGAVFTAFERLSLNAAGQVAFGGNLSTGHSGIWAQDRTGELRLIVRLVDKLDVDDGPGVDLRTITYLDFQDGSGNDDGRPSGFNDVGQLAFSARFADGTSGIFVSNFATLPEPSALALLIVGLISFDFRRSRRLCGRR